MRIALMTVNGLDFHPNGRLAQAASSCGHELSLINPYELVAGLENGSPLMAGVAPLPHVILPRQGSPMGEYGFVLLNQFAAMGIPLVSGIPGIAIARNQYITLQTLAGAGIPIPRACFITKKESLPRAVSCLGGYPVVVKTVDGMGGEGVAKIDSADQGLAYLDQHLAPRKGMVVQAFLDPEGRKDIRILVVGQQVAGAMSLTPKDDDFRANVHQQGRAKAIDLPGEWAAMALASARACCLDIAGVDMIVEKNSPPRIIEVNYSPGFRGLEQATGRDVALDIIRFVEHKISKRNNP